VFVALLKQFVLGDALKKYMWVGIFWNVVSIILVGITAVLSISSGEGEDGEAGNPLLGICLILGGALVQSLQYAFEERVMTVSDDSEMGATPPLMLIGMEGFWGTMICLFILYPLAYYLPGSDHGSIENPFNTYALITSSPEIQSTFVLYFFSVLAYNILACLVTFMLSSVWHAILDNFRPITVWGTDLFIFYFITTTFGEAWTRASWVQVSEILNTLRDFPHLSMLLAQVLGLVVLLYGTAIYNAPNAGSIK
jgi:drug/metabolite transporter (DMT)-like permease